MELVMVCLENGNIERLVHYFLIHENDYIQVMEGRE